MGPFLGGIIADKYTSLKNTLLCGALFSTFGALLLVFDQMDTYLWGLSFMVTGSALFKSNIVQLLGQENQNAFKEALYTRYYVYINLGTIIGTILCAVIGETYSWSLGFLNAFLVHLLSGILCLFLKKKKSPNHYFGRGFLLASAFLVLSRLLLDANFTPLIFVGLFFFSLIRLFYIGREEGTLTRMYSVLLLMGLQITFNVIYEQSMTTLCLFTDRVVDRTLSFGLLERVSNLPETLTIPVMVFQIADPVFSVVLGAYFAGFFSILNTRFPGLKPYHKFLIGLFLLGTGFLLLGIPSLASEGALISWSWLIYSNLFFVLGELMTVPVGLSQVSNLGSKKHAGELMGIWFLSMGSSQIFSGYLASWTCKAAQQSLAPANTLQIYGDAFNLYGGLCIMITFIGIAASRFFKKNSSD